MTRGFLSDEGPRKAQLVDIAAQVKRETDKAWLIFDGKSEVWIPKSQAEKNSDGTFTMAEWMANEKGLI